MKFDHKVFNHINSLSEDEIDRGNIKFDTLSDVDLLRILRDDFFYREYESTKFPKHSDEFRFISRMIMLKNNNLFYENIRKRNINDKIFNDAKINKMILLSYILHLDEVKDDYIMKVDIDYLEWLSKNTKRSKTTTIFYSKLSRVFNILERTGVLTRADVSQLFRFISLRMDFLCNKQYRITNLLKVATYDRCFGKKLSSITNNDLININHYRVGYHDLIYMANLVENMFNNLCKHLVLKIKNNDIEVNKLNYFIFEVKEFMALISNYLSANDRLAGVCGRDKVSVNILDNYIALINAKKEFYKEKSIYNTRNIRTIDNNFKSVLSLGKALEPKFIIDHLDIALSEYSYIYNDFNIEDANGYIC